MILDEKKANDYFHQKAWSSYTQLLGLKAMEYTAVCVLHTSGSTAVQTTQTVCCHQSSGHRVRGEGRSKRWKVCEAFNFPEVTFKVSSKYFLGVQVGGGLVSSRAGLPGQRPGRSGVSSSLSGWIQSCRCLCVKFIRELALKSTFLPEFRFVPKQTQYLFLLVWRLLAFRPV